MVFGDFFKKFNCLLILSFPLSFLWSQSQCLKGNCENGHGTMVYSSGAKYVGEFNQGKIHGKGIFYYSNGNKYIGNWKERFREGLGRMIFANGDEFFGEFEENQFNGFGTMIYANGDRYEGHWASGKCHGFGTFFYASGDRYEGNFQNGLRHGEGGLFYANEDQYLGQWENDHRHGIGTLTLSNGTSIEGKWEQDQYSLGNPEFESLYIDTSAIMDCTHFYCSSGLGQFLYPDSTLYIGEFLNGEPNGVGRVQYNDGTRYEGGWKFDMPHGKGVMYYANGDVQAAIWECGGTQMVLYSNRVNQNEATILVEKSPEVKIWAVVVGVAHYPHMPSLRFTDDDAYQFYAFLKSPEGGALPDDQVKLLIDENAERKNIIQAIQATFLKADENDVVLFYFSGHGLPGAFLPIDYDGEVNGLNHKDLHAIFEKSLAKHKIVFADACHSGSLTTSKNPYESIMDRYYKAFNQSKKGTALLLSSKSEEYSLEDGGLRSGVFSHFLIKGLKGEADADRDQLVSIKELFDFVFRNVRAHTGNVQTPLLIGEFDRSLPVAVIRS